MPLQRDLSLPLWFPGTEPKVPFAKIAVSQSRQGEARKQHKTTLTKCWIWVYYMQHMQNPPESWKMEFSLIPSDLVSLPPRANTSNYYFLNEADENFLALEILKNIPWLSQWNICTGLFFIKWVLKNWFIFTASDYVIFLINMYWVGKQHLSLWIGLHCCKAFPLGISSLFNFQSL